MDAAAYDAWYRSARGAWIGDLEYRLLWRLLAPLGGSTLLDVGCGTGYFTRRFAQEARLNAIGLDPNPDWLEYARAHGGANEAYLVGDARELPFADASVDLVVSVTALCFIEDQRRALREIARVTRKGLALGLLNRRSLLYRQKGRQGGAGAYRGARWHTTAEARELASDLTLRGMRVRSAVFLPSGRKLARIVEQAAPNLLPWGGFIALAGRV